jgi:hypothetical protein
MNLKLTDSKPGEVAENPLAAVKKAKEPFVIEWRQFATQVQRRQDEGGAGCSCGGGNFD